MTGFHTGHDVPLAYLGLAYLAHIKRVANKSRNRF